MAHGSPSRRKSDNDLQDDDDEMAPPPDGGWGWVVVWASFMVHIISEYIIVFLSILFYF